VGGGEAILWWGWVPGLIWWGEAPECLKPIYKALELVWPWSLLSPNRCRAGRLVLLFARCGAARII
jgi:hypothetical protein